MMEWLRKARNSSDSTKNKLALIFAISITALIVGLWILVLKNKHTETQAKDNAREDNLKPLFMIFKDIGSDFKTFKSSEVDATSSPVVE
jgi:hypothetical protein